MKALRSSRNLGVNRVGYRQIILHALETINEWLSIDSRDKGATTGQSYNAKGDHRDRS